MNIMKGSHTKHYQVLLQVRRSCSLCGLDTQFETTNMLFEKRSYRQAISWPAISWVRFKELAVPTATPTSAATSCTTRGESLKRWKRYKIIQRIYIRFIYIYVTTFVCFSLTSCALARVVFYCTASFTALRLTVVTSIRTCGKLQAKNVLFVVIDDQRPAYNLSYGTRPRRTTTTPPALC